jgi:hypothetical protein
LRDNTRFYQLPQPRRFLRIELVVVDQRRIMVLIVRLYCAIRQ